MKPRIVLLTGDKGKLDLDHQAFEEEINLSIALSADGVHGPTLLVLHLHICEECGNLEGGLTIDNVDGLAIRPSDAGILDLMMSFPVPDLEGVNHEE